MIIIRVKKAGNEVTCQRRLIRKATYRRTKKNEMQHHKRNITTRRKETDSTVKILFYNVLQMISLHLEFSFSRT